MKKYTLFLLIIVGLTHFVRAQTIANNSSTQFLVPYVLAKKTAPDNDNSPGALRTGWDSAFGLYNSNTTSQHYRFKYFDSQTGMIVAQYKTAQAVEAKKNLFTIPEVMGCDGGKSGQGNCIPETTFSFESGDPNILGERRFDGYVIVEDASATPQPFYLSSWMARGGGDLLTVDDVGIKHSFGYNRVAWQIPAIPIPTFAGKTTNKIIFPGLNLRPRGTVNDCPDAPNGVVTGVPNGWNIGLSVVNRASTGSVIIRLSFVQDGSSTPVVSTQTETIGAGQRKGIVVANHLPNNLGKGVLIVTVESGSAPLLGFAAQSDDLFQFLGYGVTGQVIFNEASSGQSNIENLSSKFVFPYAVRAGNSPVPREGNDTGVSVYNPGTSELTATFHFFAEDGTLAHQFSFPVPAGGALYKRMVDFPVPDGFLGWVQVASFDFPTARKFYCVGHAVRGGFDSELFGWQSFSFDVPAIPSSTINSTPGLIYTALDHNPEEGGATVSCPPIVTEDISPHDNGFDVGVRVTNVDNSAVTFRLAWQPRWTSPTSQTSKRVSMTSHTLNPNQSIGIVVSNETFSNPDNLDPVNLKDGTLIVETVPSGTLRKIVGVVVQSDKFFRYFSYSVTGQQVSTLP